MKKLLIVALVAGFGLSAMAGIAKEKEKGKKAKSQCEAGAKKDCCKKGAAKTLDSKDDKSPKSN